MEAPGVGDGISLIVQPVLRVPPKIAIGIANDILTRNGSVVRDGAGRIVAHLEEVHVVENAQEAVKRAALKLSPKIVIPVGAALVAGGLVIAIVKKRNQNGEVEVVVPECVEQLDASLRAYLEAASEGKLDVAIIDQLLSALDAVREYNGDGSVAVTFSLDQLETVFSLVRGHTQSLADAYHVDLTELREQATASKENKVIDLRRHLEAQRRIIGEAA